MRAQFYTTTRGAEQRGAGRDAPLSFGEVRLQQHIHRRSGAAQRQLTQQDLERINSSAPADRPIRCHGQLDPIYSKDAHGLAQMAVAHEIPTPPVRHEPKDLDVTLGERPAGPIAQMHAALVVRGRGHM